MAVRSVIIVPGLLASYINRPALGPPFTSAIWIDPVNLLTGQFDWLALPLPDQPGLPPRFSATLPGTYIGAVYGALGNFLRLNGYPTFSPVFDWRRPLAEDAARLAAQIQLLGKFGGVGLVCHSRGGLVARKAAQLLSEGGGIAALEAVVTLGTPHSGAMNAVVFLSSQGTLTDRLKRLPLGFSGVNFSPYAFANVDQVLRSWPSVYELLPDPYSYPDDQAALQALYRGATWSNAPTPPYGPHLAAALAQWQDLPGFPQSVRVLAIAGTTVPTATFFERRPSDGDLGVIQWVDVGDGTVIVDSALRFAATTLTVPCAHDLLALDSRLWLPILSHLGGGSVATGHIGGALLQLPGTASL